MPTTPSTPPTDRRLIAVLAAAALGWMFDGLEMGMFPLIARPALQHMQATQGVAVTDSFVGLWMGYVTAAFLLGAAGGGVLFGWLGDKIGRVRAMALSILCYSLFTGLVYFATEPWHLLVTRFVAAFGMGGEWSLGVALVMEVWPEKHRPILAGVIGAAANVGYVLIAVIGVGFTITTESWRWVALVGAAPAILTFAILAFVPESERWKEAQKDSPGQPLREVLRPPLLKATLLATLFASVALIGTWGSVQWLPLWADQMAQEQSVTKARAELAAPGATVPASEAAVLTRAKELKDNRAKAYTQGASAVGAIVGCLLGAWMGGRLGRRPAYFLLCLASLLSCAWLFRSFHTYDLGFLALTFVIGGFTAAFYGWLPLYLPELFPTRVRATGQGLSFNSGRILAAVGALQMGSLMQHFNGSYAKAGAVITLIYIVGMVVIWLAPETKGRPLPE
ncbi:MAG: MFS transporter [Opitutus sp.]|nr:MFS transporter [Opitutus sp.]